MPNFSRSSFIPKSVALSPKCIKDPLVLELKSLNNNMRRVDAYIVLGLNGKRKLKEE
jgi:DNA polymerase IIIc chi subunit